jgi:hypothetical protein
MVSPGVQDFGQICDEGASDGPEPHRFFFTNGGPHFVQVVLDFLEVVECPTEVGLGAGWIDTDGHVLPSTMVIAQLKIRSSGLTLSNDKLFLGWKTVCLGRRSP